MDDATDPHQELIDAFRATAKENAARAVARFDVFHFHVHNHRTPQQEHELNKAGLIIGEELFKANDYYHAAGIGDILCDSSVTRSDPHTLLHYAGFHLRVLNAYAALDNDEALATGETFINGLQHDTSLATIWLRGEAAQLAGKIIEKRKIAEKQDKPAPAGIVFTECSKDIMERHVAEQLLPVVRKTPHFTFAQFLKLEAPAA